jgi:hypothetical protein
MRVRVFVAARSHKHIRSRRSLLQSSVHFIQVQPVQTFFRLQTHRGYACRLFGPLATITCALHLCQYIRRRHDPLPDSNISLYTPHLNATRYIRHLQPILQPPGTIIHLPNLKKDSPLTNQFKVVFSQSSPPLALLRTFPTSLMPNFGSNSGTARPAQHCDTDIAGDRQPFV